MADREFIDRVRQLKVHERAVRAPSSLRSEKTHVFPSLEGLIQLLEGLPPDLELEVARKKDRYVLYVREGLRG